MRRCPSSFGNSYRGAAVATALAVPPVFVVVFVLAASPAWAQLNCNPGIEFYAEGPIKQCNLNGNHRLHTVRGDVVVCADGHALVQFPDGRLRSCAIAESSTIAGRRCDAPARIDLARDGTLESCRKT